MIAVGIFINNERIELFDDEKISVNSSIQNINDISKVFTDYSQTFTVPASKRNNRIFKHWYENSLEEQFSTNVKVDAYIELDTILFRRGKVQLESCSIIDGQPQNYSITFIGSLASLKDKFAGLFLKDLDSNFYDFNYSPNFVRDRVTDAAASQNVMFPLISSDKYWTWGTSTGVNVNTHPIRYNELFPALRVKAVFDMIVRDSKWNINFDGTFLTDARFTNAYLWLKNAEEFEFKATPILIAFQSKTADTITNVANTSNSTFYYKNSPDAYYSVKSTITITPTVAGIPYKIILQKEGLEFASATAVSIVGAQNFVLLNKIITSQSDYDNQNFSYYIIADSTLTFNASILNQTVTGRPGFTSYSQTLSKTSNQTVTISNLSIKSYFPEIKIEDFFSGILKMFNLTCFSEDGINFTVEQLESYYENGVVRDVTKYIKSDNINLNRVKTLKKINFEYEKSESIVNVGFLANNGVEYGSLLYSTGNDGDEYSIKLPFENLNFSNLNDRFQVGYALKSDLAKYVPKPVILYDYFPAGTVNTANHFHFATDLIGNGTAYADYKAFGQEYLDFSLNFNSQQSTLTNELITKSLYNQYYENYFANIFSFKSRIYKAVAVFPISILTSLKLNDRLIILDKKFIINTMQTDLTTGEVQLELLTDFRL